MENNFLRSPSWKIMKMDMPCCPRSSIVKVGKGREIPPIFMNVILLNIPINQRYTLSIYGLITKLNQNPNLSK